MNKIISTIFTVIYSIFISLLLYNFLPKFLVRIDPELENSGPFVILIGGIFFEVRILRRKNFVRSQVA
jgi:hypothetical protein